MVKLHHGRSIATAHFSRALLAIPPSIVIRDSGLLKNNEYSRLLKGISPDPPSSVAPTKGDVQNLHCAENHI